MKFKFQHILMALAVPAIALLAACGDDGTTSAPKPTLTFQTGAGFTFSAAQAQVDSVMTIGMIATSNDKKLKMIQVKLSTNGGTAGVVKDTITSAKTITWVYKYKVQGTVGDVLTLTALVTDDNGETASQSFNIEIVPPQAPVKLVQNQQVWNLQGPNKGAYDLNLEAEVGAGQPPLTKDLLDKTTSTAPITFSKAWTSGNGTTKFVRVTKNDWDNTTNSNYLWNLYKTNAANTTTSISNLALGDYILVKTGQSVPFSIYIIRVDEVKDTPSDNNDYVKFSFYKADI
ncbi:MAG: hypothetical protein JNL57_08110 [Bacteroidetes bacterium]|nr:hypothetical protein [Bacteroidota bacterium]